MFNKKTYKITAAALAAAILLSACAKSAANDTPPSSLTAENPVQVLPYTSLDLASDDIAVEAGGAYYLPLGEGKYVPAGNEVWQEYLDGQEFSALENFSMPFVAVDKGDTALVYVIENPYRTTISFSADGDIRLKLTGETSSLYPSEANTVRLYTTENNAVAVTDAYKSYLNETTQILTLAQKVEKNPDVAKLYGAPHIYLWGEFLISENDVNWQAFIKSAGSPVLEHISTLLSDTEERNTFTEVLEAVSQQDFVDKYQRSVLLRGLSTALFQEHFYEDKIFPKSNNIMEELLKIGVGNLKPSQRTTLHKYALYENLPEVFTPVENWYSYESTDIIDELKAAGIDTAWIGLSADGQAYRSPKLTEAAAAAGYLVGPYDSYHSIHEPGKEQWETASFPDLSLYENATVQNEKGEKLSGFQDVGRKLNPTLAMPSVQQRVSEILSAGLAFNSWFVDCDATGEVYDDYSPAHPTTKQQDIAARLERMDYIAQEHGMVMGSEGGNDFAANSIAFAHGIELPAFSWMDKDMSTNKDSEYYLGRYYSSTGGVPEKFSKTAPLKEKFETLFLDVAYQVPLFKLVYNDSVITSYQWEWSTFKIIGETENRMLREVLYNVPPMYHLDRKEWDNYKEAISAHHNVWSEFSKKAITKEMTDFAFLTDDHLVQSTCFGQNLQAVANFSDKEYQHEYTPIPPKTVLIIDGNNRTLYTPQA